MCSIHLHNYVIDSISQAYLTVVTGTRFPYIILFASSHLYGGPYQPMPPQLTVSPVHHSFLQNALFPQIDSLPKTHSFPQNLRRSEFQGSESIWGSTDQSQCLSPETHSFPRSHSRTLSLEDHRM